HVPVLPYHAPPSTRPAPLSLHDALPISTPRGRSRRGVEGDDVAAAHAPERPAHAERDDVIGGLPRASESRPPAAQGRLHGGRREDRKSTRLNSSHEWISYAVFCLKKTMI